ncbi:hypothetical protein ASPACDRAFT_52686 [Aspergillus aculeatus ATCC 16872]|uniref:Zn(2)-C6 fungal-type domain-containing protein n=1 Tax=Aspergillus aculeatus (strain ATCC 16872 / CBS 172.66 / WB 5094) TaxID=690307 RepID=A0A1L9WSW8_ASPA1|nr:uncharacterized protein ASPACDRAFT_52686 [Aspergillus aculeatus ATCC 16872]OJJ99280.1 hypothetical protein ASPACDRAFT_52686 [Aspergillus aculeatus ATCC 16872]
MFQCSHCDKSYQRKSHLLRHEATHTTESFSSICPICNKAFQKQEVARRHSKICARKYNRPPPPASKPGRKKRSCDECTHAKTACDKNSPCSRCKALGRQCSFGSVTSSPTTLCLAFVPPSLASSHSSLASKRSFFFLSHFTDPAVVKDKLAIAETAKSSTKRNLDALHLNLEDALSPFYAMQSFMSSSAAADMFFQPSFLANQYPVLDLPSEGALTSGLARQLNDLMVELVETSNSMGPDSEGLNKPLNISGLIPLFTTSNLSIFISAYFQSLHWHLPIVHFPTFDPGNVSNSLLISIFLAGAIYTTSEDGSVVPPRLLDVAEEYIFRRVASLSTASIHTSQLSQLYPVLEIVQAALIIEMLQFGQGGMQTRRRIRIIRHPCVISLIRSIGIFHYKRSTAPQICDELTWRNLIAEEVLIRVSCWAFLADGFLTVCFNNHPALSIFELDCDFPWDSTLFEAESTSAFNELVASTDGAQPPLPTIRQFITRLLDTDIGDLVTWSRSLAAEHLLLLMYAMHSLAFQARTGLLGWISPNAIKLAADNWKRIWDSSGDIVDKEKTQSLGYPKHAEELWWLLNATLDRTAGRDRSLRYLDTAATDDLGKLNEFIHNVAAEEGTP